MTPEEVYQYFAYHNENIRSVEIGFEHIRKQIKALHGSKNAAGVYIYLLPDADADKIALQKTETALSRIFSGIQVSWAEENIKRLLYEKNLLTDGQRIFLLEQTSLEQRWRKALKIVFAIAYDLVPAGDENCTTLRIEGERRNLGDQLVDQYQELKSIINDHLVPNFSIRNKVQHGEWEHAFKPRFSAEYGPELTAALHRENLLTTTERQNLVNAFYQLIVDLGRFKSNRFALDSMQTPFEYFYPHYIKKIKNAVKIIDTADLPGYIRNQIAKEIRGTQYKRHHQPGFFKSIILYFYKLWTNKQKPS
jgi:hypothetical protein